MAPSLRCLVRLIVATVGFGQLLCAQSNSTASNLMLRIDIMKSNFSELHTTTLTEANVTLFDGGTSTPPARGITGELIPFSPLDACTALTASNYTTVDETGQLTLQRVGPLSGIVALVGRGNCPFETKFQYAARIPDVIAVLIYNDEDSEMIKNTISLTQLDTKIPGFFITNTLGTALLRKIDKYRSGGVDSTNDVMLDRLSGLNITKSEQTGASRLFRRQDGPVYIQTTLSYASGGIGGGILEFVLIGIVTALAAAFGVSIYMHLRVYRATLLEQQAEAAAARDAILDEVEINDVFLANLPVRVYKSGRQDKQRSQSMKLSVPPKRRLDFMEDDIDMKKKLRKSICMDPRMKRTAVGPRASGNGSSENVNETCPICIDEFYDGDEVNELPCNHCYHPECIRPWLKTRSPCCPLCKTDVREAYRPNVPVIPSSVQPTQEMSRWRRLYFGLYGCFSRSSSRRHGLNDIEMQDVSHSPRPATIQSTPAAQMS